jgi:ubiquinone/menaquinone biosynthesis C-methylase UbiE
MESDPGTNQSSIFLAGEGDNWFSRNVNSLTGKSPSKDVAHIIRNIPTEGFLIEKILEIGCSNAFKLEELCKHFLAFGFGIDPSTVAIQAGLNRLDPSNYSLRVGTSADLPFPTQTFKIVFFSFCLYLVNDSEYELSLTEADRVLKHGGFLIINDFDYGSRAMMEYAHDARINSFKRVYDISKINNNKYHLVSKESYSHRSPNFDLDQNERIACQIYFKE